MRRGLVIAGVVAGLAHAAPVFLERAEELRFLWASELLGIRLQALALEPGEEQAEKALHSDLPLFAGSLEAKDPALLGELEEALEGLEGPVGAKDVARLEAIFRQAQGLLERARRLLAPEGDPTLQAALIAQLVLLDDGVAESYEDAARGEEGAYQVGRVALQRVRVLWQGLKPALAGRAADEAVKVEEGLNTLGQLFSSPTPPPRFQDPEDGEQAALDIVFALAAATGAELLPQELPEMLALVERQASQACQAYPEGKQRLALERIAAAGLYYETYLGDTLQTLAPEVSERLKPLLEGLPGAIRAGEAAKVGADCKALTDRLAQARDTLR
ncbi:hypothetical protein Mterra_00782 [Calidithermus terrae]|uniref:Uncharacterized protein n=1 Tax=Calidithermus terrae TaxID=1408545 RepID=A0A399F293_9DEIN|nr:hypothetical protein [Calidithermus terrae]RIH89389.1 hypothetical protein Mterra_00782 [Calidithermus terrae]